MDQHYIRIRTLVFDDGVVTNNTGITVKAGEHPVAVPNLLYYPLSKTNMHGGNRIFC